MMMRVLAVGLATLVAASPAHAAWMEATTTHFRLVADASPAWMEQYAARLERFDQSLRLVYNMSDQPGDSSNRLTVYVVRGDGALQKLYSRKSNNVLGFYRAGASGTVAYVSRRASSGSWDLDSETILKHEYAHHFMLRNYAAIYPPWFTEGFAEFVATAEFNDKGDIAYGKPPYHRAYGLLMTGNPLPVDKMLALPEKLTPSQREAVYGRGWLMTHYLTFESSRTGQLTRYLTLMGEGVSSLDAAEQAFGDLKALDKELERYLGQRLRYVQIPAADLPVDKVSLRPLSRGEVATITARMRTDRGVGDEEAARLVVDARRLAEPFPDDPDVQVLLAETEYDAGNDDAAEAAADRALAARPEFVEAMVYKALARLRRLDEADVKDAAQWREARSWLIRANHQDNDYAWPLMLYYDSFRREGETPTPTAVAGLHRAFELVPQAEELRMKVVMQSLWDGKPQDARILLIPLTQSPHGSASAANQATRLLELIDAGKTDPASLSAWQDGGTADDDSAEGDDDAPGSDTTAGS